MINNYRDCELHIMEKWDYILEGNSETYPRYLSDMGNVLQG